MIGPILMFWLGLTMVLNFLAMIYIFSPDKKLPSENRQRLKGVLGMVNGFFILAVLMGWIE